MKQKKIYKELKISRRFPRTNFPPILDSNAEQNGQQITQIDIDLNKQTFALNFNPVIENISINR
ncbi:Uncharacterised protein [Actinobacillus equuli]|nr:Uncharacterised protein [Actinobacillus equuli]